MVEETALKLKTVEGRMGDDVEQLKYMLNKYKRHYNEVELQNKRLLAASALRENHPAGERGLLNVAVALKGE